MSKYQYPYDVVVETAGGEFVGYMLHWGADNPPISIETQPPELPIGTSVDLSGSPVKFTARDAAPPYPIVIEDWTHGQGQDSYDYEDSHASRYAYSRCIDVTQRGHFELGPMPMLLEHSAIQTYVISANDTFVAGFTPNQSGSNYIDQLRYFVVARFKLSGEYLPNTTNTTITIAPGYLDAQGNLTCAKPAEFSLPATTGNHIIGAKLYCPVHDEIVTITARVSNATFTVERGEIPQAHTADCLWALMTWIPMTYTTGEEPSSSSLVSGLATDGDQIHVAITAPGANSSALYRGRVPESPSTSGDLARQASSVPAITSLHVAAGYLWGVSYTSTSGLTAGYFSGSPPSWNQVTLSGAMPRGAVADAGLASTDNTVYWAVACAANDRHKSFVYAMYNDGSSWKPKLVAELPTGFAARSICSSLGKIYVGGAMMNDQVYAGDTDYPYSTGYLYRVSDDGAIELAASLRVNSRYNQPPTAIEGMVDGGGFIYLLAQGDVYVYDLSTGGVSHYSDAPVNAQQVFSGTNVWYYDKSQWAAAGFYYLPQKLPTENQAILSTRDDLDTDSDGYLDSSKVSTTNSSNPGLSATVESGVLKLSVQANNWYRWKIAGCANGSEHTVGFMVNYMYSEAGCFVIGDATHEVRVFMRAPTNAAGEVQKYQIGLGEVANPSVGVTEYIWKENMHDLAIAGFTAYVSLDGEGAELWVNGRKLQEVPRSRLRYCDSLSMESVWFSVGWPGLAETFDNKKKEKIYYTRMMMRNDGAVPDPSVQYGSTMSSDIHHLIAFDSGVLGVCCPGTGFGISDNSLIVGDGWLDTSETALHTGSLRKFFVDVIIDHSAVQDGQTLTGIAYVDGVPVASGTAPIGSEQTTIPVLLSGERIYVGVNLSDPMQDRPYPHRLRVYRITARFYPSSSQPLINMVLNCREHVQRRDGRNWGQDPEYAIAHLFNAASSGELVSLWLPFFEYMHGGSVRARIESVTVLPGTMDRDHGDRITGTVYVRARLLE